MIKGFQNKGLNSWARKFVANNHEVLGSETITRVLIGGGHEFKRRPYIKPGPVKKPVSKFFPFEGKNDSFDLHFYILPDYSLIKEHVQTSCLQLDTHPCFKGSSDKPLIKMLFLQLVNDKGEILPQSIWSKEEIEEALA